MKNNEATPGYNTRLSIYFTTTKSGQLRAFRQSNRQYRALPISVDQAKLLIATGGADLIR